MAINIRQVSRSVFEYSFCRKYVELRNIYCSKYWITATDCVVINIWIMLNNVFVWPTDVYVDLCTLNISVLIRVVLILIISEGQVRSNKFLVKFKLYLTYIYICTYMSAWNQICKVTVMASDERHSINKTRWTIDKALSMSYRRRVTISKDRLATFDLKRNMKKIAQVPNH